MSLETSVKFYMHELQLGRALSNGPRLTTLFPGVARFSAQAIAILSPTAGVGGDSTLRP